MTNPDHRRVSDLSGMGQEAFGSLVQQYQRELLVHCYRLMGALHDAEDMLQETYLRAWRARGTYAGKAPLRAWLYKIATHACLDALRQRKRRFVPRTREAASDLEAPIPASVMEPIWLEPLPEEWLAAAEGDPESIVIRREHIRLAFIAALHRLTPQQRAVLLLREVLGYPATEAATLLELSVPAVKSALHRARTAMAASGEWLAHDRAEPDQDHLRAFLADYVRAWEAADADALARLLREDATFSMPPIPAWYRGREIIRGLTQKTVFAGDAQGRWRLLSTQANSQTAFGLYRQSEDPVCHAAYGIQVLTFDGEQLADIITFRDPALLARFGLPTQLEK